MDGERFLEVAAVSEGKKEQEVDETEMPILYAHTD